MKVQKAIYAASLDPITNGHINVIERMAPLYDEFVVLVAVDSRKVYTFTPEERVEMAKSAVAHLSNVSVDVNIGCYVVRQAESIGAQVIIRGLRNIKDLEDEQTLAEENRNICPQIETVWVPCLPNLMRVSSSMVKGHVGVDPNWEEQVARSVPAGVVLKLKEKFILGKAFKHWAGLMSALGNPKGSEKIFKNIVACYGKPNRFYHILEHIVSMLDKFETVSDQVKNPDAVRLTIWYHDIADSEEVSAHQAELDIKEMGLSDYLIKLVCCDLSNNGLIMATKHKSQPQDLDTMFLLDLDLAILGSAEKEFDAYEAGIRKEYSFVSEADFRAGRSRILESFLNRPSIYYTKFFQNKYESIARENLKRSIKKLRS